MMTMTEIMMKLGVLEADPDTKSMISNIADCDSKSAKSKQPIKSAKPKKKINKLKRVLKGLKSVEPIIIPREDQVQANAKGEEPPIDLKF